MAEAAKAKRVMFTIVVNEAEMQMIIDCLEGVESSVDGRIREELIDTFEQAQAEV